MADPIPQADAALLAAQAQAGQAGIAAYEAAKAALSGQRQQAIDQALKEASLRGTPLEAIQGMQSSITQPYDTQLAQLAQGQASFTGNMAARQQRSTDYNAAVGSARSLIPAQIQQQLAPILARNQFQLSQIDRQSQGRVSEIQAQQRLYEARAQAEMQAYQVRQQQAADKQAAQDAKDAKAAQDAAQKLSQSQLKSMLVEGGRANLGQVLDTTTQAAQQRSDSAAEDARFANQTINQQARDQYNARQAVPKQDVASALLSVLAPKAVRPSTPPRPSAFSPLTSLSAMLGSAQRQQQAPAPAPAPAPTPAPAPAPNSGQAAARAALARIYSQPRAPLSSSAQSTLRQMQSRQAQERNQLRTATAHAGQAPYPTGFISPDELGSLGNYGQILSGAGQQLNPASLLQLIGGTPDANGQVSPISSDLFRTAMLESADQLRQTGYNIPDSQLLDAMGSDTLYHPGSTLGDVESQATGGRDLAQQFQLDQQAQQKDQRQLAADQKAATKEQQAQAKAQDKAQASQTDSALKSEFFQQWGIPLTSSLGPRDDVIAVTSSPEFDQAVQSFESQAGDQIPSTATDINKVLDDAGIKDALTRRLIKAIYGG